MKIAILVLSDSCYNKLKEDRSGKEIETIIKSNVVSSDWKITNYEILPDEKDIIKQKLINLIDVQEVDVIITTGGTGITKRDVTPEATKEVIEKELTGIENLLRIEGYKKTPTAVLSRGICGVRKKSFVLNLPGSINAVRESLSLVIPLIPHIIDLLSGHTEHNIH